VFVQPSREVPLSLKSQQYSLKDMRVYNQEKIRIFLCISLFAVSQNIKVGNQMTLRGSLASASGLALRHNQDCYSFCHSALLFNSWNMTHTRTKGVASGVEQ